MSDITEPSHQVLLCSNCFTDEGLRIDAAKHGQEQRGECPNCQSPDYLRRKVEAGRASMRAGIGRSNDEVEAHFAARRKKISAG